MHILCETRPVMRSGTCGQLMLRWIQHELPTSTIHQTLGTMLSFMKWSCIWKNISINANKLSLCSF